MERASDKWTDDEVQALLALYATEEVQREFEGTQKNLKIFAKISTLLADSGIYHTTKQCREKIKKLKQDYKKIKDHNNHSGANQKTSKWFDSLDQILGHRPAYSGNAATKDSDAMLLESIVCGETIAPPEELEENATEPNSIFLTASSATRTPCCRRPEKRRRERDEMLQYMEYMERSEQRLLQQHRDICTRLDSMEADRKVLLGLIERMVTVMEEQAKK